MVELYLDDLNDLLLDKKAKPQKLDIKEDPNGMMYIQGVTVRNYYLELRLILEKANIFN